jgi:hypothetical protein
MTGAKGKGKGANSIAIKGKWLLEKKILEFESLDKIVFVCSNP